MLTPTQAWSPGARSSQPKPLPTFRVGTPNLTTGGGTRQRAAPQGGIGTVGRVAGGPAASPAASTPAPSVPGDVGGFPTTPLPLTATDVAELTARRGAADRHYGRTLAETTRDLAREQSIFDLFTQRLRRDTDRQADGARGTIGQGGFNFATSPLFAGAALNRIREGADRKLADQTIATQGREEALRRALTDAEEARRDEIDAIARDRARRASGQGRFETLIQPIG